MRSGTIDLGSAGSTLIAHCARAGHTMTHLKSDSPVPACGRARGRAVIAQPSADAVEAGDAR